MKHSPASRWRKLGAAVESWAFFITVEQDYIPKVYAYERFSTFRQDEQEQEVIIRSYCDRHRISIDEIVVDKGVSGKTEWTSRNLAELVAKLRAGDIVIVSEASRLSRSMSDFSEFLNKGMRKIGARIIVCNMGLDIDCGHLTAMVEMQLQMLMFAAQMERELISGRTKAALDARKESARINGGWTSKSGAWCTHLGRQKGECTPQQQARQRQTRRTRMDSRIPEATRQILEMHRIGISNLQIAKKLNEQGLTTESGKVWHDTKVKRIINLYEQA